MSSQEPETRRAVAVTVTGTVQGVGFRPFVARTAAEYDLAGSVRNTDDGVRVRFEGVDDAVAAAVDRLRTDPPPLADVGSVRVRERTPRGAEGFDIVESTAGEERTTLVPPDTGLCPACRADVRDPDSRYHDYWATACVDCGPRFTVTRGLPYDREQTALADFDPCPDCRRAYETPTDRRFHAQTVACPDCGPTLALYGADGGRSATGPAALDELARRLRDGALVGIKGAGGSHLACRARDVGAVDRLRAATGRPAKPYALMAPELGAVREFARVGPRERALLTDQRRPIVVLERRERPWLRAVAPGLHTVGVMLPYSGLHHLLFDRVGEPLVMTSANRPGEPMATTRAELCGMDAPDAVLAHDREVVTRCDDSVVRVVDGERAFLRRSRGWVPERLPLPVEPPEPVVAVGGRSDVTVAVADDAGVVPSQHVGSVENPATERFHREATAHLTELLGVEPAVAAHDRHPGFRTTALAEAYDREVPVGHHHAHAAGLLAEHGRERAVVVAADGTGYGPDGVVRGGEVLESRLTGSERVGGLSTFRLPGGEAAVRRPARTLAALLDDRERATELLCGRGMDEREAATVRAQAERGTNAPPTTSAGRFLDAAAALLGVCTERTYQGEPAMRLEAAAGRGDPVEIEPPVERVDGETVFRADRGMSRLADLAETVSRADAAATAQAMLAEGLGACAVAAAERAGVEAVGFTGGVAYNPAITARLRERVTDAGFDFLHHDRVPPGDAGLAYGQAVTAAARLAEG